MGGGKRGGEEGREEWQECEGKNECEGWEQRAQRSRGGRGEGKREKGRGKGEGGRREGRKKVRNGRIGERVR